jgi:RND family efflux transporter MFP subunit
MRVLRLRFITPVFWLEIMNLSGEIQRLRPYAAGAILMAAMGVGGSYLTLQRVRKPIVVAAASGGAPQPAAGETPVAGALQLTQEQMELAEVRIEPAVRRSVADKLPVTGEVEPSADHLVMITPRVAGKIVSISAGVGDRVRTGQVLALLSSTDLAAAQAAYHQGVSRVRVAEANLRRQKDLGALGEFGRPKLDGARGAMVAAQGALNEAEQEAAAAQNEVSQAQSERATAENEAVEAESDLVAVQSEVTAARARLAQAKTQVNVTRTRRERQEILFNQGLTSKQDWEQSRAEDEKAHADVEVAEAGVTQAEARVRAAQAHIASARSAVKQAEAKIATTLARERQVTARRDAAREQLAIARQTLTREGKIYAGRYMTSKEIVEAEASLRQAVLERDTASQSVRLLGGEPGGGSTLPLAAPIAGRVQERRVTLGQTVATDQALFTVANLDEVWVQLAVPPRDLCRARAGQRVELTADTAPGRIFQGSVSYVGSAADEKTRAVKVRCTLANGSGLLRPGTFVRGSLITDQRQDRLTVPDMALEEHSGKPTIYVAQSGKSTSFEVRHVKLGARGPGWREITEGLEEGEKIAVDGTFFLKSEALKSSLSDACCSVPGK